MDRRGFLGAMLAACAAPAIVRAGSLMRIAPALIVTDQTVVIAQYGTEIGRIENIRFIVDEYVHPDNVGADPFGSRGYAGNTWWKKALIDNNGWMAVGNAGLVVPHD